MNIAAEMPADGVANTDWPHQRDAAARTHRAHACRVAGVTGQVVKNRIFLHYCRRAYGNAVFDPGGRERIVGTTHAPAMLRLSLTFSGFPLCNRLLSVQRLAAADNAGVTLITPARPCRHHRRARAAHAASQRRLEHGI